MSGPSRSLLDYLDAPVVVGDPDGRAVYLNPAFESRFGTVSERAHGRPLANLFEGGCREAVLQAVAGVCAEGRAVRFRLREEGVGYSAVASPISADQDRVGVVVLLTEELAGDERVHAAHRSLQARVDDLIRSLSQLAGGGRPQGPLADAVRCAASMRSELEKLEGVLVGGERRDSDAG